MRDTERIHKLADAQFLPTEKTTEAQSHRGRVTSEAPLFQEAVRECHRGQSEQDPDGHDDPGGDPVLGLATGHG